MYNAKYLSGIIHSQLEAGSAVVLISIVGVVGSAPRQSGTKMVVDDQVKSYGTIGGSLLEANAIIESGKVLTEQQSKLKDFDFIDNDVAAEEMICGGKATILLDFIPPTTANRELFSQMHNCISRGKNFYFLTAFTDSDNDINIEEHCLLFPDGTLIGDNLLTEKNVTRIREELHNISVTTIFPLGNKKVIIDPIRTPKTFYCFGAGHVALPTAHIAAMVGFQVIIIDDREEFANAERFPEASHIYVIDDYRYALQGLNIDKDSYIAIMTRGHKYDRVVLEQALQTDAAYIGMISSRSKRDAIYSTLITEGLATPESLERIHSPIGIAIGGETPEEIAVSIVAELIYGREKQEK